MKCRHVFISVLWCPLRFLLNNYGEFCLDSVHRHDIAELLLKVALNFIKPKQPTHLFLRGSWFIYYRVYVLFMLFVFIYVYWCPTRFIYQMLFVSFNSNTTVVTRGAGTADPSGAPEFTPSFWWGSCCSIFYFLCNVL